MAVVRDYDPAAYRGGIAAFGVAAAVLIGAVSHPACRVGGVLAAAPLRWVGRRSYGIYLWHWPVMALTRPGADLAWPPWLLLPLQLAATVLLAAASYRWIEMPVRTGAARAWLDRRAPRARLAMATGGALALVLAAVTAVAGDGGARPSTALAVERSAAASRAVVASPPAPLRPLAVGASVMLASRAAVARHARVDAAVGRQVADILARLDAYRRRHRLPPRVVVQIGENGPIYASDIRRLRTALAGAERVVLVNVRVPRSWEAQANATIAAAVRGWAQARLVDWHRAGARPGLLYDDGVHPTPRGRKAYARLVARALR
jgi:hypothetical protein